jgi:hypothetical protein
MLPPNPHPPKPETTPAPLELPPLPAHLQNDRHFLSAYARALVAMATANKPATLADFAALMAVARNAQYPALMGMLILHALETGAVLDAALADLARAGADAREAGAAWQMAGPLLQLQGHAARPLARRLAAALGRDALAQDLASLPEEIETSVIGHLTSRARQWVKGRDASDALFDFGKSIGDAELMRQALACRQGSLSYSALKQQFELVQRGIVQDIAEYRARAQQSDATLALVGSGVQELRHQTEQRLAMISARIHFERTTFAEDIEDLVHDAGNAIENAIAQRLHTDKWQDKDVWASIANTQFGKEAERRIARAVQRREQALRLFKEELKLFQADMQVVQASILSQQHHASLAQLMPPLRLGTRVVNAIDSAANVTLGAGTLAVAGTGAAVYLLGSAAVLPLVAPAAPFLAGALAAAGLFKWFTDSDKRKINEIQSKRRAIEAVVRQRLEEAAASFNGQLTQLEQEYRQTAISLLHPMLLDAEAATQLQERQWRVANRVIAQLEATVQRLAQDLPA